MKKLIVLTLLTVGTAFPADKLSLTLEQAVAIGLENSKALHSSLMRVQYADAKSSETNTVQFPSIKVGGSYTRLSDVPPAEIVIQKDLFGPGFPPQTISSTLSPIVLNNYNLRLTVQQPLFTGFRLQSSVNAAGYNAEATAQDYNKDRSDLVYNVKNAYWSLFKAQEFEKFIEESVEQIQAHLADVQNMFDQGMATKNELLRVEVQLSNTKLILIGAKNTVKLAMLQLNNVVGLPLETQIEPASNAEHMPQEFPELESLVEAALANRPEIKAMDLRVKASEAGVTAARSNWFPQIYLVGNYYYARPNQRLFPAQDVFKDTWDVGLSLSLDLWNWGSTIHQTNQAQAQLAQARDSYAQLKDGIRLDVTQSYLNLGEAKEKIAVAKQAVAQAEENHRVTVEKFKAGLALNSDVLDAETALLQTKVNHTQAVVDYELAEAQLEKAIGRQ